MIWTWVGFILLILGLLALDLGVLHRKAHVIGVKEALGWSAFWISLALLFSVFVYFGYEHHWVDLGLTSDGHTAMDPVDKTPMHGHTAAVKYIMGYVIEESLSVDNLFVIALILAYFQVPAALQHRLLFWGILGALIMRGTMIGMGAALIAKFHWIIYIFGLFLIVTAVRMLFLDADDAKPGANPIVKLARRWFPVCEEYHGKHFIVRSDKAACAASAVKLRWMLTPMALALVMVETTDLIFAVDSIPAIFAITGDPFIVFTSNVFAILGLRSLFFALAGMMDKFRFLKVSLAIILAVVGVKMLISDWLKALIGDSFNFWLLGVIAAILIGGSMASILANRRDARHAAAANGAAQPPPNPAG
jgi:tellurite resistance protein TerC